MFDVIAFDADDTLWENELLYQRTEGVLRDLLARYRERPLDPAELYATEQRNLAYFGYGVKGFALSLIETAIELTAGEVSARDIQILIDAAREMLARPVQLLYGVQEVVSSLAATHELMLVTK